jgi:hypothetical protein
VTTEDLLQQSASARIAAYRYRNLLADNTRHAHGFGAGNLLAYTLRNLNHFGVMNRLTHGVRNLLHTGLLLVTANGVRNLLGALLFHHMANFVAASLGASLRNHLANFVAASLGAILFYHPANLVAASLGAILFHHVADLVGAGLGASLGNHLANLVAASLGASFGDHFANGVRNRFLHDFSLIANTVHRLGLHFRYPDLFADLTGRALNADHFALARLINASAFARIPCPAARFTDSLLDHSPRALSHLSFPMATANLNLFGVMNWLADRLANNAFTCFMNGFANGIANFLGFGFPNRFANRVVAFAIVRFANWLANSVLAIFVTSLSFVANAIDRLFFADGLVNVLVTSDFFRLPNDSATCSHHRIRGVAGA